MTFVPITHPAHFDRDAAAVVPDLADSLAQLLESARREIDDDQEAAKASIARASSLLRVELERVTTVVTHDAATGRLAGWQVNRLRAFIDDHLDGTIHITDLAKIARRSTAYFCRAFKRTFDETPHAYIVRRRLLRGRHLMLTTDLPLSEIALSCGFTDQAHLCRLFRLSQGQSPAAWRRERRDGAASAVAARAV